MNKVIYTIIIYSFLTVTTLVPSDSSRFDIYKEASRLGFSNNVIWPGNGQCPNQATREGVVIDRVVAVQNQRRAAVMDEKLQQPQDSLERDPFIESMINKGDKAIQDNGEAMRGYNLLEEFCNVVELSKAAKASFNSKYDDSCSNDSGGERLGDDASTRDFGKQEDALGQSQFDMDDVMSQMQESEKKQQQVVENRNHRHAQVIQVFLKEKIAKKLLDERARQVYMQQSERVVQDEEQTQQGWCVSICHRLSKLCSC